ncbi:lysophospholipid acyltransferase family protein [Streptomyces sp. NPDC001744]|uniref:lysophospholipid acyltransferase family protein n=1 Tax=Streptomyces sp. NPDC001744 TaxID=3364606 RepID=UPI00369F2AC0
MPPWFPTAPCTPGRCTAHPGTGHRAGDRVGRRPGTATAGPLRALARLAAGAGTVLLGVLLAPGTAPLPSATRLALVRCWARTVVRAFGVRARYTGNPAPAGPLLVVANHVSWLDVPLLAAVLPGRAVAKAEVRHWPVLGTLAALGGTLFVERDRLRALPGTVRAVTGALADGGRVVVFPEGSTWCGRAGGRFRPAVFQAALDAGCAVQPVRIAYRPTEGAAYVGDDPLGASLWRVVTTRRLTAEVHAADPLPGGRYPDRRALAAAAERAVARPAALRPATAQRAVASDSANLSPPSVHQRAMPRPAAASSSRTPS